MLNFYKSDRVQIMGKKTYYYDNILHVQSPAKLRNKHQSLETELKKLQAQAGFES